jgi:energy-coupling factor transport system ATP-binding protein
VEPLSVLNVENLTFRYRERPEPSLVDISFQVEAGELILLAGASGSGKTTLIRCINGLIPRSYKGDLQGTVFMLGQDMAGQKLAQISQLVGTVLQDPERQILGSRVRNEVAFGLENLAVPREEIFERIDAALDHLGIYHLKDRETFLLSGGEKQKVALAGILAMRPSLLLLDEPLASLDPASAQETLALVRSLADEGLAVLLVEHRVEDVLSIHPERVMFMEEGQMRYLGPLAGLYDVVNYRVIKLPSRVVIERASKATPPQEVFRPSPEVEASKRRTEETPQNSGGETASDPDQRQAQPPPLVQFEKVSFAYEPGSGVLHEVDMSIRRGDVIAVLGPNGAGKTTLVKHAIGLLKPRSGRVLVQGRDTRKMSVAQIANTLGYVFQSPSHMLFASTVEEELSFGPKNLGHDPETIEKEVMRAIEIVNLTGREKDAPLSLSFGQQKRVTIAAILAMKSRILVMDEPTAGQDYSNYMEFMDAILRLPHFDAILFITHDIDLAVIFANRVLLVNQGRLVADGPPEEILGDLERLVANRLVPTSLLEINLEMLPKTGRFMRAEALAHISSI